MTDGSGYGPSGSNPQWPVNPASAPPSSGPPASGPPGDGQPAFGQPGYGQPGYGPPAQPNYGPPAQPNYGPPAYGQPAQPAYGQPAYGQPAYGPPAYGPPAYGPPAYGQPDPSGYPPPDQPGGFQPYAGGYGSAASPPPKRGIRRFWPWLAGAAGVIVVLIIIAAVVGSSNANPGKSHTLSAPAQTAGYTKITGNVADQVSSSITTSLAGKYSNNDVSVAVYSATGSTVPEFVFLGVHSGTFANRSASDSIASFMKGAQVGNASSADPGPLGGKLSCGTSTNSQTVCVWVDHNTLGTLVFVHLSGSAASTETVSFRSDAEK